jgi:hypothetical protein
MIAQIEGIADKLFITIEHRMMVIEVSSIKTVKITNDYYNSHDRKDYIWIFHAGSKDSIAEENFNKNTFGEIQEVIKKYYRGLEKTKVVI